MVRPPLNQSALDEIANEIHDLMTEMQGTSDQDAYNALAWMSRLIPHNTREYLNFNSQVFNRHRHKIYENEELMEIWEDLRDELGIVEAEEVEYAEQTESQLETAAEVESVEETEPDLEGSTQDRSPTGSTEWHERYLYLTGNISVFLNTLGQYAVPPRGEDTGFLGFLRAEQLPLAEARPSKETTVQLEQQLQRLEAMEVTIRPTTTFLNTKISYFIGNTVFSWSWGMNLFNWGNADKAKSLSIATRKIPFEERSKESLQPYFLPEREEDIKNEPIHIEVLKLALTTPISPWSGPDEETLSDFIEHLALEKTAPEPKPDETAEETCARLVAEIKDKVDSLIVHAVQPYQNDKQYLAFHAKQFAYADSVSGDKAKLEVRLNALDTLEADLKQTVPFLKGQMLALMTQTVLQWSAAFMNFFNFRKEEKGKHIKAALLEIPFEMRGKSKIAPVFNQAPDVSAVTDDEAASGAATQVDVPEDARNKIYKLKEALNFHRFPGDPDKDTQTLSEFRNQMKP